MARKTTQRAKDVVESDAKESKVKETAPQKTENPPEKPAGPSEADAPPVEDTELLEMLEHLSKTIDTAQSVLDEQHRMVMDVTRPQLPPLPGVDRFEPMPEPPEPRSGVAKSLATVVFSAFLAVGVLGAWWLYLNKTGSPTGPETAKDESRITDSADTPNQVAELSPVAEPPLPSKNPVRQVVAEATALPASRALETAPTPDVPGENIANIERKVVPTPYQPIDAPRLSPEQTASIQTLRRQAPAGTPAAPTADPEKPVPAQDRKPRPTSTVQKEPSRTGSAEPDRRAEQQTSSTASSAAVRKKPADAQPKPGPVPPQTAQRPAGKPDQSAKVARVEQQTPATADKLEPKKRALQPLTKEEEQRILRRGAELSELGDIAGARLALEYAALRGNAEAMYALARTFDPDYLATRGVVGLAPDVAVAVKWYQAAAEGGIDRARARARELESQVSQRR